ncbi:hypothetical protein [Thalassovita aquimarina]|nr:hypothetical protein [Thalassovita aquimarina]
MDAIDAPADSLYKSCGFGETTRRAKGCGAGEWRLPPARGGRFFRFATV